MESHWPENLSIGRKKLTEVLNKGQESAINLQVLFKKPLGECELETAKDLAEKVWSSFTEALSELNSGEISEGFQSPVTTPVSSAYADDRKTEDSGDSRKFPGLKDRRGCYKRRKISHTWARVTSAPIEDDFSWRKYGQKPILNAKYPRNYFRCTHKIDQGCQATKQVQRTEDDPPLYRTTYMGRHTCKNTLLAPKLILDSSPRCHRDSFVLNFQSNITPQQNLSSFSSFQSIKQEEIPNDLTHNIPSPPSDYHIVWPDLTTFESSGPTTMLSSTPGSELGDVTSDLYTCTPTTQSLDMGFLEGSIDFEDFFKE